MGVPRWLTLAVVLLATAPSVAMSLRSESITPIAFATNKTDALLFRSTAELLLARRSPYDATLQAENLRTAHLGGRAPPFVLPFLYPPNALPLFGLYGVGSPRFGYVLFTGAGTLLLLVALYAILRRLGVAEKERLLALLGVGVGGATLFNAELGQTGAFAGALALLYMLAYWRSKALAGLCLGLLAFKPQYAVFFAAWPLAAGDLGVLATATATALTMTAVSCAVFGWGIARQFVDVVAAPNESAPNMASWFALARPAWHGAAPPPEVAFVVALAAFLALVAACVVFLRRGADVVDGLGLSAAVAVLASPSTHPYDLTLWALPLLALVQRSAARYPGALFLGVGLSMHPFLRPDLRFGLALGSVFLASLVWRNVSRRFYATRPGPDR